MHRCHLTRGPWLLAAPPFRTRYSGQRLGFMINDILDASQLKNKKMELSICPAGIKKEAAKVVFSLKAAKDLSSGRLRLIQSVCGL